MKTVTKKKIHKNEINCIFHFSYPRNSLNFNHSFLSNNFVLKLFAGTKFRINSQKSLNLIPVKFNSFKVFHTIFYCFFF